MPLLIVEGMRENLENGRRGHANQHRSGREITVRIMIVEGMRQYAARWQRAYIDMQLTIVEGMKLHAIT